MMDMSSPTTQGLLMRNVLFLIGFTLLLSFPAYADTCASAPYSSLLPAKIKFGMTSTQIKRARKLKLMHTGPGIEMFEVKDSTGPYGIIIIKYTQNVATRIIGDYRDSTVSKLGGTGQALNVIGTKLKEKYGGADSVDTDDAPDMTASWNEKKGAAMQLQVNRSGVRIRVDCNALEEDLAKKAAKDVELGI